VAEVGGAGLGAVTRLVTQVTRDNPVAPPNLIKSPSIVRRLFLVLSLSMYYKREKSGQFAKCNFYVIILLNSMINKNEKYNDFSFWAGRMVLCLLIFEGGRRG
jgi:hypothetical protein